MSERKGSRKKRLSHFVLSGVLGCGLLGCGTMVGAGTGAAIDAIAGTGGLFTAAGAAGGAIADLSMTEGGQDVLDATLVPLAQQGSQIQQAEIGAEPQERSPTVVAQGSQGTDLNKLIRMAEADCPGQTYRGPRDPGDHSRFQCVHAFFLECRIPAKGESYRQAHQEACARISAWGSPCPHCP